MTENSLPEGLAMAALEASISPIVVTDARRGDQPIIYVNPAFERMTGYSVEECLGKNCRFLQGTDRGQSALKELREALQEGRPVRAVLRNYRKNGEQFWNEINFTPLRDGGGEVTHFIGVQTDITDRKRAEQTFHDSEARLRTMIDTAVDGIIIIDAQGTVQLYNAACERLFGYGTQEVVGQNVKMLMPSPYHEQHDGYIKSYRETGVRKIIGIGREVVGRRKDGSTFPMELSVGETRQDGAPVFVGMIHDVTDRKHAEDSLRHAHKMEAIGQLTGGVAHDFNNLLTVILGNLEMLEARMEREEQREILQEAQEAAELGAQLTDRLLAFARRQPLEHRTIDLNELVTGMSELLHRTLGEDIKISTVMTGGIWPTVTDPGQVENALLNLAINARDAMPGGGTLTVETANVDLDEAYVAQEIDVAPGPYVKMTVSDNGEGMPPEVRERAFEPFFTTKQTGSGTGLGLSMIYGFAKQSGGHLTIYSEPGHGTAVSLYLPRVQPDAGPGEPAAPGSDTQILGRGETVLVVEDDARVRRVSVSRLKELGYHVLEADSGPAALDLLAEQRSVDLIFTDLVMPGGMTGSDLAREVRRRHPGMKILFTSGYAGEAIKQNGALDEDAVILRKPYKKVDLARRIRSVLDT
jgi:PAS domain S-box-containing protein